MGWGRGAGVQGERGERREKILKSKLLFCSFFFLLLFSYLAFVWSVNSLPDSANICMYAKFMERGN